MSDTDSTSKRPWQFQPGNKAGQGRRPKRLTEDVEGFLYDALNIKGAKMLVEAMTSATKLCGAEAIEHPDWKERLRAFEVIRDTVLGKPTQVVTGEDGAPIVGVLGVELLEAMRKMGEK